MAYRFVGFFARPVMKRPIELPEGAIWREILHPFVGVGIRWLTVSDHKPDVVRAEELLQEVGLGSASDWLFLTYQTWAGRIDSVYGVGNCSGKEIAPPESSEDAETTYVKLMSMFGLSSEGARDFTPFARGFWDEVQ